jgi:hypothetical protein
MKTEGYIDQMSGLNQMEEMMKMMMPDKYHLFKKEMSKMYLDLPEFHKEYMNKYPDHSSVS